MSRWDKLLKRILTLSKDLRFDELRKVLESYGYEMTAPKGGSSHYTFRKAGCQPITMQKKVRRTFFLHTEAYQNMNRSKRYMLKW